jgi:hypothetical protein
MRWPLTSISSWYCFTWAERKHSTHFAHYFIFQNLVVLVDVIKNWLEVNIGHKFEFIKAIVAEKKLFSKPINNL